MRILINFLKEKKEARNYTIHNTIRNIYNTQ